MDKQNIFNHIRVVLCQTSHPGNIGSTARAMKTMGLNHLYLVNPLHFPDPQATSLATGAADLLETATVCTSMQEALTGCVLAIGMSARKRQISHELVNVREAAERAVSIAHNQPIALVFGIGDLYYLFQDLIDFRANLLLIFFGINPVRSLHR